MGDDWAMFFNKIWTGLHPISDKANEIPIRLHETHFYISKQFYDLAKIKGLIVDGSEGGLVFGPSHANGGVQLCINSGNTFSKPPPSPILVRCVQPNKITSSDNSNK